MNASYQVDHIGPYQLKLWFTHLSYLLGLTIVLTLYRFTWYYPRKRLPQTEVWQAFYVLLVVVSGLTLFTRLIIKDIEPTETITNIIPGVLYWFYVVYFAVAFTFAMLRLWWERRQTEDILIRTQIGYFRLGLVAGGAFGLMTAAVLPVLAPQWETVTYAPLSSLIIIIPMALAFMKSHLMDVRQLMVRILAYLLSFMSVFGCLAVFVGVTGFQTTRPGRWIALGLTGGLLLFTNQLVEGFDAILRKYLFRDAYQGRELLARFNSILSSKADLAQILAKTAQLIEEALAVEYAVFGARKGEDIIGRVASGHGKLPKELDIARLSPQFLHTRKRFIHIRDLSAKHKIVRSNLLRNKIGLAVRISKTNEQGNQLGFLITGVRKNGRPYTRQDIKFITAIVDGLGPIIEKSLTVEQDFEHVTQEMYRKNLELVETNRTLSLLRAIDALVLESQDSLEVLTTAIAKAISGNSNFTSVAIFARMPGKSDLELFGRSLPGESGGAKEVELPTILLDTEDSWLSGEERSLRLHVESEDLAHHRHLGLTKTNITQLYNSGEVHMVYLLKLQARQKVVGAMAIGFVNDKEALSQEDIGLLERLSDAVGVAVDNRLLFEENKRVLAKLQKTNDKLRALDEAKDEFISMASHQLRTPLTSVKGYVSMVLEGDAGKIPKAQHDLLGQAFASSQRMVYLIADLLNVSRLRTGKFVIENKPTQLAEVVETELSQLQEAAKSKKQTLTYKKPGKFPELMMDETKIRQVIMNFTDNALYYTQPGGKIAVNLENKGKTIEFTVVDNGIGVPKAEQHKLFGKFYRAGNARKARPDGTGLGLFMAKKVIIAQGGSVIFKTAENKGSTFGFSFPVAKLKVTPKALAEAQKASSSTPMTTAADKPVKTPAENPEKS